MPGILGYKRRDAKKLEARRFAAVTRLRQGESTTAIARSLGVSVHTVQRWARCYRVRGLEGLRSRPKTGGPQPKLAREKLAQLREMLEDGPVAHGFDTPVWTTERVTHLIWQRFRVRYSLGYVKRHVLPCLQWKWHKHTWLPRPRA